MLIEQIQIVFMVCRGCKNLVSERHRIDDLLAWYVILANFDFLRHAAICVFAEGSQLYQSPVSLGDPRSCLE